MKKHSIARIVTIFLLLLLTGCACRSGASLPRQDRASAAATQTLSLHGEDFLRTELFFGMSIAATTDYPAAQVTESQWRDFVDTWITPRFPHGLTVLDGYGQWLGKDGVVAREHSKVLILLHSGSDPDQWAEADRAIEEIRAAYRRLFHQESVLRVTSRAGVSF